MSELKYGPPQNYQVVDKQSGEIVYMSDLIRIGTNEVKED